MRCSATLGLGASIRPMPCAQSVCMGSGGMEAKEAADWVTTDVDDDGLWNAFVHLGLIDQE